jgi:hypothetical protein
MNTRRHRLALLVLAAAFAGCGSDAGSNLDSTPEKLDGTESHEFEQTTSNPRLRSAMPSRSTAPEPSLTRTFRRRL